MICITQLEKEQSLIDASKADYLPTVLKQLKDFRANFYTERGKNFELSKQVATLVFAAKGKDVEMIDLKTRVKMLTESADSRIGFYWWIALGTVVGLAGAGAVAVIFD